MKSEIRDKKKVFYGGFVAVPCLIDNFFLGLRFAYRIHLGQLPLSSVLGTKTELPSISALIKEMKRHKQRLIEQQTQTTERLNRL